MKRFAIIAVALLAAVPLTRFAADYSVDAVQDTINARLADELDDAIGTIESDFANIQTELRSRALAVARDPNALFLTRSDFVSREPPEDVAAAITNFQRRHAASGPISLELYGPGLSLRAWSGISILPKPDELPASIDTVAKIDDDPLHKALVIWVPVGLNGFVRAAYALETSSVEHSFLGYDDVADQWRKATDHQLKILFDDPGVAIDTTRFLAIPLENERQEVLATVVVSRTSGALLVRAVSDRFESAEAFWWILLFGWLLAGFWVIVDRWLGDRGTTLAGVWWSVTARLTALVFLRYAMLAFEVPGRWFDDGQLSSVFNPVHLASEVGWGIARSIGDLAVTSLFLFAMALAVFHAVKRYRPRAEARRSALSVIAASTATVVVITVVLVGHAVLTRQSMIDTTLDFFAWTGLSPQPLVLIVFCSLLLSTIAALLLGVAAFIWLAKWSNAAESADRGVLLGAVAGAALTVAVLFQLLDLERLVPWWSLLLHFAAMIWPAQRYVSYRPPLVRALRIRSILVTGLVAATLLYPLLYEGMDEQRRLRLLDAAADFAASGDAQAVVGLRSVFEQMATTPEISAIARHNGPVFPDDQSLQSLAFQYPVAHMVPGIQRAIVALYDSDLRLIASFEQDRRSNFLPTTGVQRPPQTLIDPPADSVAADTRIMPVTDASTKETIGFVGVRRMEPVDAPLVWVVISLDRRGVEAPFGAVFSYLDWRRSLSLAEFRDGRRTRSEGENFERYVLPTEVQAQIDEESELWQNEEVYGRAYVTYYREIEDDTPGIQSKAVVAVRARAIIPYDHLYYLLRIAIAGLWLGIPAYLLGLVVRWRMGLIPARRQEYGDRVLDAFLIVGILAVAGMGMVGQQVITRENDGAIKSRLQRRLQRVEDAMVRAARPDEPLYEVQRRLALDSLANQLSLDLTVYHGPWLVESSTPVSDAGPLMGYRLPTQAYDDLFIRRFRQSFVESSNLYGEVFTIGYKALSDEDGWPRSVIAVLTFPEQARIREERARTTAYFFGALLLLLLVIMATATTLARALTGPLRRLRDGMQSVAAGRVQKPIPVESRDEVGQLVETFNLMQNQLSESRRKLAQQERELAWSEMARQVAHEIKNPLTPMKLSIQHLQRAYEEFDPVDPESKGRFAAAFDRITKTVSEQIGTLVEIANEFSTFARLPRRHVEVIDPNEIIGEAVKLSGTELAGGIEFHQTDQDVYVAADPDELRRVVINLLKNAVQSVQDDGRVEVFTRATSGLEDRPDVDVFLCEVVDNGMGIAPEVQSRIFQPNFSTKTSGMGLGLAISKKSIEAMGGSIGFSTELGRGSTFWIRLPLVES